MRRTGGTIPLLSHNRFASALLYFPQESGHKEDGTVVTRHGASGAVPVYGELLHARLAAS
jgi:hypothetical protein